MFQPIFLCGIISIFCLTNVSAEVMYDIDDSHQSGYQERGRSDDQRHSPDCGLSSPKAPSGLFPTYAFLTSPTYHPEFFSAFFTVIGFLEAYEEKKWVGYSVNFGSSGSYYEPSKGGNWWSYYFKPVEKKYPGVYVDRIIDENEKMAYGLQVLFQDRIAVNRIITKYIEINRDVQETVDDTVAELFGNDRVIGVNFQRPERAGNISNSNYVNFFNKIDSLIQLDKYIDGKIFVSTDDIDFLVEMINRYGDRVVYRDIPRNSDLGGPVYYPETPNYDRGFDEIVECLMLSNCDAIVRTNSNISTAASFFNPSLTLITVSTYAPTRGR